jgi:hypothetical protein
MVEQFTFGEQNVGIELYLGDVASKSDFKPIECTVKHRFSDFIVNEID